MSEQSFELNDFDNLRKQEEDRKQNLVLDQMKVTIWRTILTG